MRNSVALSRKRSKSDILRYIVADFMNKEGLPGHSGSGQSDYGRLSRLLFASLEGDQGSEAEDGHRCGFGDGFDFHVINETEQEIIGDEVC